MKVSFAILYLIFISIFSSYAQENKSTMNFYHFQAKSLQGKEISMNEYAGKVVLVVNTASKCGFTPQYEGLEKLYKEYKDKGLVILGFPCNQFGNQEPGTAEEISRFCTLNYSVNFPMFMKIDVNGENADPLYKYLKVALPETPGNEIKWNFTKFLIDRKGVPVKRYGSIVKPEEMTKDIQKLLAE
jgi:glutathione peroxidase